MAVQSVERAMGILGLFTPDRPLLGVTEIAEGMGLGKPTVHALIKTLVSLDFLQQDPATSKYQLGLRLLEVGSIAAGNLEINQKAGHLMQRLAVDTKQVCRIGLWSQNSILVVFNAWPEMTGSFPNQYGPRVPAYCTALGKAVLAFIPPQELDKYLERASLQPRTPQTITDPDLLRENLALTVKRGYSISNREVLHIQAGLGAPVFGRQGVVLGAVSISGSPERILGERKAQLAATIMDMANTVSRHMGYYPELHDVGLD